MRNLVAKARALAGDYKGLVVSTQRDLNDMKGNLRAQFGESIIMKLRVPLPSPIPP